MISPCKECLNHSPTCHGKCERYAAYRDQLAEMKKKQRIDTGSEYRRYYFDNNNMSKILKNKIKKRTRRRV